MTEIDPGTRAALDQLRREWSPPSDAGVEARMLADFHARLAGPNGDGGSEGGPEGGARGPEALGAGGSSSAAWIHATKIVAAVIGLTGAGVAGVALVGQLVRPTKPAAAPNQAPIEATIPIESSPNEPPEIPEPSLATSAEPAPTPDVEPEPAPDFAPAPRRGSTHQPASVGPNVDLAAELALLRPARAAQPTAALELLDRHATEFPAGALASEREALRAAVLCGLGRLDQARDAVERLQALDPGPLLRERVRAACEGKIELPTTGFSEAGDGSP